MGDPVDDGLLLDGLDDMLPLLVVGDIVLPVDGGIDMPGVIDPDPADEEPDIDGIAPGVPDWAPAPPLIAPDGCEAPIAPAVPDEPELPAAPVDPEPPVVPPAVWAQTATGVANSAATRISLRIFALLTGSCYIVSMGYP